MRRRDWFIQVLCCAVTALLLTGLMTIVGQLFLRARPTLSGGALLGSRTLSQALRGLPVWDGLWPAMIGTLALMISVTVCAFPLGLGCAFYLALSTSRFASVLRFTLGLLAGVPSIVLGLFGFELLLTLHHLWPQLGTGLWLSTLCLTLLVLPPLVVTLERAVRSLPPHLREASASMGFSTSQQARYVLLPCCKSSIAGGLMLTLSRAAEDTAVIMLTGAVVSGRLPRGLFAKFDALPLFIYYKSGQYVDAHDLSLAFTASLFLLVLSLILFLLARWALKEVHS